MAQSTTVLNQILQLVPKKLFDTLASQYHIDKQASVFRGTAHFIVLMLAQLNGLTSLRDLVHATASLFSWQRDGDLVSVKRSTLADANQRIDYRFYRDLFSHLLQRQ